MTPTPRVLVIDDEPEIAKLICNVARTSGYDALSTTEPNHFMSLYRSWPPDTVILDIHIPETDGVELLRFLAGEQSRCRVVLLSGMDKGMLDVVTRLGTSYGLQLAATMSKPFRVEELMNVLQGLRDRSLAEGLR